MALLTFVDKDTNQEITGLYSELCQNFILTRTQTNHKLRDHDERVDTSLPIDLSFQHNHREINLPIA